MNNKHKNLIKRLRDFGISVHVGESFNKGHKEELMYWFYIIDSDGEVFEEFDESEFTSENILNWGSTYIPRLYTKGYSKVHDEYLDLGILITKALLPKY